MNKIERFYNSLGEPVEANNGDFGYFVMVGDLVKNGGAMIFFGKLENPTKKWVNQSFVGLNTIEPTRHIMRIAGMMLATIAAH